MRPNKILFPILSVLFVLTILILPTIVSKSMPMVETRTVISLTNTGSLLPKSVVQQGDNPCVFQLVSDKSFWNDGFVTQSISIEVIESYDDSVLVTGTFHPSQELVVLDKNNMLDGIHVRRAK